MGRNIDPAEPVSVPAPVLLVPLVISLVLVCFLAVLLSVRFINWAQDWQTRFGPNWLVALAPFVLVTVFCLSAGRWCCFLILSFRVFLRKRHQARDPLLSVAPLHWPLVSIFVPAYNESETISRALQSLLRLDYPRYEIIVVDDGSSDDTFDQAKTFAGNHGHCTLRVLRKPNGGKWSAHNHAFHHSRGELILCLDADSQVEPSALKLLVRHMADAQVAAVAGQIRVRNRINLLTRLQGLEYLIANGALRMAQSSNGTVLVVPGPIGLFRRSVLEEVYLRYGLLSSLREGHVAGPFEGDTFAEDFDLSVAILSLGYRIEYEPRAVSQTKAPDSVFGLLNQRYRWCRGTIQVLRKYFRRARSSPEILQPRLLAWISITYLFELLMVPFAYTTTIVFLVMFLLQGGTVVPFIAWTGAFLLLNANVSALFVSMHRDRLSLLHVLPCFDLYHGFLLNSGWAIAAFDEIRGVRMRW
jgi:poly-beta-1,6-N-acetyl-D-glucosamine synthase